MRPPSAIGPGFREMWPEDQLTAFLSVIDVSESESFVVCAKPSFEGLPLARTWKGSRTPSSASPLRGPLARTALSRRGRESGKDVPKIGTNAFRVESSECRAELGERLPCSKRLERWCRSRPDSTARIPHREVPRFRSTFPSGCTPHDRAEPSSPASWCGAEDFWPCSEPQVVVNLERNLFRRGAGRVR